jgi:RHS repeat-associated protein
MSIMLGGLIQSACALSVFVGVVMSSGPSVAQPCDDDGVGWGTLQASRQDPPGSHDDDVRDLGEKTWFLVPPVITVDEGQSGDGWSSLSWRNGLDAIGLCLYRGGGHDRNVCTNNENEYRLAVCTVLDRDGLSLLSAGDLFSATHLRLRVETGAHCGTTAVSLPLLYVPDADGDGQPQAGLTERGAVRRIDEQGRIERVAGAEPCSSGGPVGSAPLQTNFCSTQSIATRPDGSLFIARGGALVTIEVGLPNLADGTHAIPSLGGSEVYVFEQRGRHLRTVDALTGVTRLTFGYSGAQLASVDDGLGNVVTIDRAVPGSIAITAPFGQTTRLALDAEGLLGRVTDPIEESVVLGYGPGDLLTSFSHPLTGTSTFSYDARGALEQDVGPGGETQTFAFHRLRDNVTGRSTETVTRTTREGLTEYFVTTPLANGSERRDLVVGPFVTRHDRTAAASQTVTYPDGARTVVTSAPDPRFGMHSPIVSRVVTTTQGGRSSTTTSGQTVTLGDPLDPLSLTRQVFTITRNGLRTWTTTFDKAAGTFTSRTPLGRQAVSKVDGRGRVVEIDVPERLPIVISYDARGRLASASQGDRLTTYEYGSDGRLAKAVGPDSREVSMTHDAIGRTKTVTRADGKVTTSEYQISGRRQSLSPPGRGAHASEINPEARSSRYEPPAAGASATRTAQANYDGRLESLTYGNGDTVQLVRDGLGRPTDVTTPRGVFTMAYDDPAGRLSSATTPEGQTVQYAYDSGLSLGQTSSGLVGGTVVYGYDTELRLESETVQGQSVVLGYDNDDALTQIGALSIGRSPASGDVSGTTLGFVTTTFGRNGYGEIDERETRFGATPLFAAEVIEREPNGRIQTRQEDVLGEARTFEYGYDLAGRLTDVVVDGVPASHYEYDDNGNRLVADATAATFDAQDRIQTSAGALYTHTPDGALESKTVDGTTTIYRYDLASNLLGVTLPSGDEIGYVVDPESRRVGRTWNGAYTHRWIYGAAASPAAEVDASGQITTRFVYGTRAWVPDYMVRGGVTYALVTDALGSVRLVVDVTTGLVAQRLDYDPFGGVLTDTNSGFQPFGYAGGLYDPETKLVRLGARDYDAETGRWTTKDPLLFGGGSTNLYAYVGNDPINHVDPSGLFSEDDFADAAAGITPEQAEALFTPTVRNPNVK